MILIVTLFTWWEVIKDFSGVSDTNFLSVWGLSFISVANPFMHRKKLKYVWQFVNIVHERANDSTWKSMVLGGFLEPTRQLYVQR